MAEEDFSSSNNSSSGGNNRVPTHLMTSAYMADSAAARLRQKNNEDTPEVVEATEGGR